MEKFSVKDDTQLGMFVTGLIVASVVICTQLVNCSMRKLSSLEGRRTKGFKVYEYLSSKQKDERFSAKNQSNGLKSARCRRDVIMNVVPYGNYVLNTICYILRAVTSYLLT